MDSDKRKALVVGGVALVGLGALMWVKQQPVVASPAPTPTPTPTPTTYPFAGRTRASRGGADSSGYDLGWNSVPILRRPGAEGDGALSIQSNVLMRVPWQSQVWILGPPVSGPSVFGVPNSGTYYPVAGGFIRLFDLSVAPPG